MSSKSVHPSTMTGIKRLATQLKAADGLSHSASLDKASVAAGYENLRHAQRILTGQPKPAAVAVPCYQIYITAYWRDRGAGINGRETLATSLSAPWKDLLTPAEFKSARGMEDFIPEGPDHLSKHHVVKSQSSAREAVCHAARTLQFVAATGLRPSRGYSRAYPKGTVDSRVPGQDHVCVWFDQQKRYLIADEPYEAAANRRRQERDVWCQAHDYAERKPSWAGMHNPYGGTSLYLLAHAANGVPLDPLIRALDQLPKPHSASDWTGESAPQIPYFVSPGTIAKAEAEIEKAKQQTPRRSTGQRNTVGYIWTLVGPQRRPKGRMPIEVHAEVGGLLQSVLAATYYRKGVYNRVDSLRSELDEWAQREYDRAALPDEKFFDLYYHGDAASVSSRSISAVERNRQTERLAVVRAALLQHYPDCAPLRSMVKRLDAAVTSLQTWAT